MKPGDGFAPIALIVVLVVVISAAAGTFVYFRPGDEVEVPAQKIAHSAKLPKTAKCIAMKQTENREEF